MYWHENPYMGPWMNVPGTTLPYTCRPGYENMPHYRPNVPPMIGGATAYPVMYPEIYYRLHPIIEKVCHEMDDMNQPYPTQEAVDRMVDKAYEETCHMYPDLAEYAMEYEMKAQSKPSDVEASQFYGYPYGDFTYGMPSGGYGYGRDFGRRGLLRSLLAILLINQLFRRRGYYGLY
ncbi:MAG: hypothetical protein ACOX6S_01750 [Clostridia bacterium]|jgi:hypothetical protein